eukprot:jgi/Mesvir1/26062/Mv06788-RA.1
MGRDGYSHFCLATRGLGRRNALTFPGRRACQDDKVKRGSFPREAQLAQESTFNATYHTLGSCEQAVLLSAGSFNPPTYMHLRLFEMARDALEDEGWTVMGGYMSPVNSAYGKQGLADARHRVAMCERAVESSDFIMVDPWEACQPTYQRTLVVLRHLRQQLTGHMRTVAWLESKQMRRDMPDCGAAATPIDQAPDGAAAATHADNALQRDAPMCDSITDHWQLPSLHRSSPCGANVGGDPTTVASANAGHCPWALVKQLEHTKLKSAASRLPEQGHDQGQGALPAHPGDSHGDHLAMEDPRASVSQYMSPALGCGSEGEAAADFLPTPRVLLLCGADLLESFCRPGVWIPEHMEEIFHAFGIVCVVREGTDVGRLIDGHDLLRQHKDCILLVHSETAYGVSSTKIRREISYGHSVKYLIPDGVLDYIYAHKLYAGKRPASANSAHGHGVE